MNEITLTDTFYAQEKLNKQIVNNIKYEFSKLKGIQSVNISTNSVHVEFYQWLLSSDLIKDTLLKSGFVFKELKMHRSLFERFITKLGDENTKYFEGTTPKCCGK